jgi:hypothetical protein
MGLSRLGQQVGVDRMEPEPFARQQVLIEGFPNESVTEAVGRALRICHQHSGRNCRTQRLLEFQFR